MGVSLHKVRIASDSLSALQRIQNRNISQNVANSDENMIPDALASHTNRECHVTFTWYRSHSGICGNELADVAVNEETAVEQG